MAVPLIRKMHTNARGFFFSARSTSCRNTGRRDCRLAASAHCFFFPLAHLLQVLRRRPAVLAHPPLLPPAGGPGTPSSSELPVGPALRVHRPAPQARGAR